jgi:hypothetical protein
MLKQIFKQLWRRRGANVWTGLELLIVFGLVWFMVDYFFVITYNYHLPDYWNGKHAWQINIAEYPPDHPDYSEAENTKQAKLDNKNRLLRLFASQPGVESIAVSFWGSTPGTGSYNGNGFRISGDTVSNPIGGQVILFDPAFDYFRTFDYSQQNGKRPISVADFDFSNPNGIILSRAAAKRLFPDGDDPVGKEIMSGDHKYPEGLKYYTVTGVIDDTKRFPYRRPEVKYYGEMRMDTTNLDASASISIRSSAAISDSRFAEDFRTKMLVEARAGNFYFKSITPFSKILAENEKQFGIFNEIVTRVVLMTFFLLNIILCVVGTFWYRVNSRREETGIRKALGATPAGVRNIFLLEGLCLLSIAALLAMIAEYQFVHAGLIETMGRGNIADGAYLTDQPIPRFIITNGITWAIMAAVISAAIWIPAKRAAAMQAADALHYE